MEFINTIERQLASWSERLPHLPAGLRAWLVRNIWWIMLVIAILSLLGFGALLLAVVAGGALATLLGGIVGFAISGVAVGAVLLSSLPGLIVACLLLAAVSPLRAQLAKGWRWLFLATLLDIAFTLIQLAFSMSERGLFTFVVTAAIALYVLFELRSHFLSDAAVSVSSKQPASTPSAKE